jgi:hypothetical protein
MKAGMVTDVPLVAGLAYREALHDMPQTFIVTLVPEPDNRYNPKAIAVLATRGAKIGYVAPDSAAHYYDNVLARVTAGELVSCPARLTRGQGRVDAVAVLDFSRLEAFWRD